MTDHYFENDLVNLHYYKFGNGPNSDVVFSRVRDAWQAVQSFREPAWFKIYTFYGFDLFFHKETKLKDQSLAQL
jgi:hypothetical protein